MGLDMFAYRKAYVKPWDHQSADERYSVQIARGGKPVPGIQSDRISRIEEEVMYWRKANHIHAWFVDNVQDGIDNCADYYVGSEQLRKLLAICEKVIAASKLVDGQICESYTHNSKGERVNHMVAGKVIEDATVANELLPTREGFFFGGNEYNEYYLEDVIDTRDWIVRMLADEAAGVPGDIFYSSSW